MPDMFTAWFSQAYHKNRLINENIKLQKEKDMNITAKEKAIRGLELYNEGKIDESEILLRDAANAGEINGIYGMGLIYLYRKNEHNGIRMLKRAASMTPNMIATLAKLSLGEYYASKGNFESVYLSVYYYESAFEDDYDDMRKNAADNLKFIRMQMRNIDGNRYSNYDEIALKGINMLNNGSKKDAEKMLKMSFIMGSEISWIGLALFYYPLNMNDEALTFLNRYIKRAKERNLIEEAYTLSAFIYEEEGDKTENSSVSDTISMYKRSVSAFNSALKFAQDSSSKKELNEGLNRIEKKLLRLKDKISAPMTSEREQELREKIMRIATSSEMEEYFNENKKSKPSSEQIAEAERIGNEVFSQLSVVSDDSKSSVSSQPVKSEPRLPKTVAEYVLEFENKINDSHVCFPYGQRFNSDRKFNAKMSKKIRNAISVFTIKIPENEILVYVDRTVFGSGKDFLIITERCIYYKFSGLKAEIFTPDNVLNIYSKDSYVYISAITKTFGKDDCPAFLSSEEKEVTSFRDMIQGCLKIYKRRLTES